MPILPPLVGEMRIKAADVKVKFAEAIKASDEMAKKTTGNSEATGSSFDKLGRTSKVALTAMGGGIAGLIGETGEMAGDFQEKMTLLVTGAGVSKDAIGGISDGILKMAPQVQTSTGQLADGMYMIASAGYKGADGMNILQAAAEGAKVGGADLGTTADALTTIMTDYHIPADKAAETTSKLVATVANGKTHMQDLAGSMSHVLPFAAGLGISLNDTMGAMATMTGQGIQADQAATYLKFTMMALANETPKGSKALKEVGLSSKEVAEDLRNKGLHGTLDEITEAIGKKFPKGSAEYTAALADIVGGTRGMASALALTGQNADTYGENIKKIGEATTDAGGHVEGFAESSQDFNNKMAGLRATVETLGIKIGNMLIPTLTNMAAGASAAFGFLDQHKGVLIALAGLLGGVLTVVVLAWGLKFVNMAKDVFTAGKQMSDGIISGARGAATGLSNLSTGFRDVEAGMSSTTGKMGTIGAKLRGMSSTFSSGATAALEWSKSTGQALAANTRELAVNSLAWVKNAAATVAAKAAQIGAAAAAKLMAAGQWLLNAAMSANPIALVVIAIAALVAGLIWAYNNIGWFKDMVNTAWAAIQVAIKVVVDWVVSTVVPFLATAWQVISAGVMWLWNNIFQPYFQFIMSIIQAVVDFVTGVVVPGFQAAFQFVGDVISGAVRFFTDFRDNAINAAVGVLQWFQDLPGNIMNALVGAGTWLVSVGQSIIQGLISGVQSMIGSVGKAISDGVSGAVQGVKDLLGIHSPSRVFHEIGVNTMQGYLNGIGSMQGSVADTLGSLVMPSVSGQVGGSGFSYGGSAPYGSGSHGAGSGGTVIKNYYITMNNTTNADPNHIARALGYEISQMS